MILLTGWLCVGLHVSVFLLLPTPCVAILSLTPPCSSRRLEVNRLELLLELGTFAAALGALVAGEGGGGEGVYEKARSA